MTERGHIMEKVHMDREQYPELLRKISSPPETLYCIGELSCLSERCVAVVGSRKATPYGRNVAFRLGKRLAESGVTVVSGMAEGIDAEAHRGALEAGGRTIAVLGCGPDICYPKTNRELKDRIEREGLIISQFRPGTEPRPYHFPLRNRIISGISEAVVVVEAGMSSGSLITAESAAEQGRDVYAVPGNINSLSSAGTNRLIKDGALPLVTVDDILWDMKIGSKAEETGSQSLGEDEMELYGLLKKHGEMTIDEICDMLLEPAEKVNVLVTLMEMKGIVFTGLGRVFISV